MNDRDPLIALLRRDFYGNPKAGLKKARSGRSSRRSHDQGYGHGERTIKSHDGGGSHIRKLALDAAAATNARSKCCSRCGNATGTTPDETEVGYRA